MSNVTVKPFYHTACQLCLKASTDILRCTGCKTVPYCSKEHQKADWPCHKKICRIILDSINALTPKCKNFQEWTEYRVALQLIWKDSLKRPLMSHEALMAMFPRACVVCYSKENLYDCKDCLNVAFCSGKHEAEYLDTHKAFCSELKVGLIIDQYLYNYGMVSIKFVEQNNLIKTFPRCTLDIVKFLIHENILEKEVSYLTNNDKALATDVLKTNLVASGLTILYGLTIARLLKMELVIHVVGISDLEYLTNWSVVTDMIKYWWNNEIYITYYLIGPEEKKFVGQIAESGSSYRLKCYNCFYHEVIDHIEKPDLIVAFNCGFHEFETEDKNTWKPTIPLLLKYLHVPLLLTSYTELEMKRDKQIILDLGLNLHIMISDKKNPYASLKPIKDWTSYKIPVFYSNNYIFMVERMDS